VRLAVLEISRTETLYILLCIFGSFSGLELKFLAAIDQENGWMMYFRPIYHRKAFSSIIFMLTKVLS
jgi:hypothetical protein